MMGATPAPASVQRVRRSIRTFLVGAIASTLVAGALVAALPADAGTPLPGSRVWVSRFDGPAHSFDLAADLGVAPAGDRVFVTGSSAGGRHTDYETVAYDAATGAELWARRYHGRLHRNDNPMALEVAPDGSAVFVTGVSAGTSGVDVENADDYATVAYAAATGTKLWARRYDGPDHLNDTARAIAVSADGSRIVVTGESVSAATSTDYATVAYDALTGAHLWTRRFDGPGGGADDHAAALAVSPDGSRVVVTGGSTNDAAEPNVLVQDYATVAYDLVSGAQRWVRRYRVNGGGTAIGISPDGSRVFVAGYGSDGPPEFAYDYATVTYDAETGTKLWASRYGGSGSDFEIPSDLEVSPDGGAIFVTGHISGATTNDDYGTVAFDAGTGATLWSRSYDGPGHFRDHAADLGVSPDGTTVFVTGVSSASDDVEVFYAEDYATVAYDASSGAKVWLRRYDGPAHSSDGAIALGVAPDGSVVFVTGTSRSGLHGDDYLTVAYAAGSAGGRIR